MPKLAITDLAASDIEGKRCLIRVDFNVPQDKQDPSIITNTQRSRLPSPPPRAPPRDARG